MTKNLLCVLSLFMLTQGYVYAQETVAVLQQGVPCRAEAGDQGELVATLGFPALVELVSSPPDGYWSQVRTGEGLQCFVDNFHVGAFDPDQPEAALTAIAKRNLLSMRWRRLQWEENFHRLHEVLKLFERGWQGVMVEGVSLLELQKMQLIQQMARTLGVCRGSDTTTACHSQSMLDWGEQYADFISYHYIGWSWFVDPRVFWSLHDRFRETPGADEIAWAASRHIWQGECEGSITCNLQQKDGIEYFGRLEYLKRQPNGKHRAEAATDVMERLLGHLSRRSRFCELKDPYDEFNQAYYTELQGQTAVISTIINNADLDPGFQRVIEVMLTEIARPCRESS